jgi:hypothetical protein
MTRANPTSSQGVASLWGAGESFTAKAQPMSSRGAALQWAVSGYHGTQTREKFGKRGGFMRTATELQQAREHREAREAAGAMTIAAAPTMPGANPTSSQGQNSLQSAGESFTGKAAATSSRGAALQWAGTNWCHSAGYIREVRTCSFHALLAVTCNKQRRAVL